jgi:Zn finger protein HypA/HybF involved in hydrogenase expression
MHLLLSRQTAPTSYALRACSPATVALLFCLGTGGVPRALAAQLPTTGRGTAPPDSIVFQHSLHQKLACAECHGASARKGSNKVMAPSSCRSCHHRSDQTATCTSCHASEIKFTRQVPVIFKVVARRTPAVTRNLPFRHEQHGKLDCAKCHGTDTDRAVQVNCTSCHADHHEAERNCTTCHPGASAGHDRTAHNGCSVCHANAPLPSISASRTLCLTCHERQRDHNPGGSCASCHAVSSPLAAPGARRP